MACPFCKRDVEGDCRRPSCRVRAQYRDRPVSLLPAPELTFDSEWADTEVISTNNLHDTDDNEFITRNELPADDTYARHLVGLLTAGRARNTPPPRQHFLRSQAKPGRPLFVLRHIVQPGGVKRNGDV